MTWEYRNTRNFRERSRVRKISAVFKELKNKLPEEWVTGKMSRVDILKKTTTYIRHLKQILDQKENPEIQDETQMKQKHSPGNNTTCERQEEQRNGRYEGNTGHSTMSLENEIVFQLIEEMYNSSSPI